MHAMTPHVSFLEELGKKEGNGGLPTPSSNYTNLMHIIIVACLIIFEAKVLAVILHQEAEKVERSSDPLSQVDSYTCMKVSIHVYVSGYATF
jgi:hypothetical protein